MQRNMRNSIKMPSDLFNSRAQKQYHSIQISLSFTQMAESREYTTLLNCTEALEIELGQDRSVLLFLHREGLIPDEVFESVDDQKSVLSDREKSSMVVKGIKNKVKYTPNNYYKLLEYLQVDERRHGNIVNILDEEYERLGANATNSYRHRSRSNAYPLPPALLLPDNLTSGFAKSYDGLVTPPWESGHPVDNLVSVSAVPFNHQKLTASNTTLKRSSTISTSSMQQKIDEYQSYMQTLQQQLAALTERCSILEQANSTDYQIETEASNVDSKLQKIHESVKFFQEKFKIFEEKDQ